MNLEIFVNMGEGEFKFKIFSHFIDKNKIYMLFIYFKFHVLHLNKLKSKNNVESNRCILELNIYSFIQNRCKVTKVKVIIHFLLNTNFNNHVSLNFENGDV